MTRTVVKNIREINEGDRLALEHAFGETFRDDQRLVVRIETISETPAGPSSPANETDAFESLPDWCDVYAGLTDAEIDELDSLIEQRLNLTRKSTEDDAGLTP